MKSVAIAIACTLLACGASPRPVSHPKYGYYSGPTIVGTVTAVTAGTGLTGGTITRNGTIAADTTYLQRRVTGTCASGNAVGTINADGTVTCNAAGGSGLSGLTTGDLISATSATTAGNYGGSTATSCTAGNAVTGAALSATGALTTTCTAIGSLTGTGTVGDLPAWTSSTALGNYGGSTSAACSAGQAMTQAALSAAGVLTGTCTAQPQGTVTSIATTAPITGGTITSTGTLGLSESSNFRTNAGALDLSTTVTMPGSLTVHDLYESVDSQTLASGAVTLTPSSQATLERLTCDGVSGTQINTMATGFTNGRILDIEVVSGFCEFNASGTSTTIETPNNQVVFLNGGANGDDGARAEYNSTLGKWAIVSTAKITGVQAGTGLTNSSGNSSGIITLTANLAGAACAAGTAVTSISSVGAGSCSAFATGTGTVNALPKWTSTSGALGNSNFSDDGTTATLGTSKDTIAESTGGMLLNTAGTPTDSQLRVQGTTRTTPGTMAMTVTDTDNMQLYFDAERTGSSTIATGSTVAYLAKVGGAFDIAGAMSATVGSTYSAVVYDQLTLSSGLWENKYALQVDGDTTLGSAATDHVNIEGWLTVTKSGATISACGTGASVTGNANSGKITTGTSASSCVINLGVTYGAAPNCTASVLGKADTSFWITSTSTTQLSMAYGGSAETIMYVCIGNG